MKESKVGPNLEILKVELSEGWVEFDKEIVKHGKGRTCLNQEVEVKIS